MSPGYNVRKAILNGAQLLYENCFVDRDYFSTHWSHLPLKNRAFRESNYYRITNSFSDFGRRNKKKWLTNKKNNEFKRSKRIKVPAHFERVFAYPIDTLTREENNILRQFVFVAIT